MKKTIIIMFLSFFTFFSSVDAAGSLSVNSSVKLMDNFLLLCQVVVLAV